MIQGSLHSPKNEIGHYFADIMQPSKADYAIKSLVSYISLTEAASPEQRERF